MALSGFGKAIGRVNTKGADSGESHKQFSAPTLFAFVDACPPSALRRTREGVDLVKVRGWPDPRAGNARRQKLLDVPTISLVGLAHPEDPRERTVGWQFARQFEEQCLAVVGKVVEINAALRSRRSKRRFRKLPGGRLQRSGRRWCWRCRHRWQDIAATRMIARRVSPRCKSPAPSQSTLGSLSAGWPRQTRKVRSPPSAPCWSGLT